jgi:hypothetical protein
MRQTRFGGQTTSLQSSTHAPLSQWLPPGHATPTHAVSTHVPLAGSHEVPFAQGAPGQSHAGTQIPETHAEPAAQTTPSHGSTQPKPRQRWPNGHRTPAWQFGTHVFDSSHVAPGGQPKTEQSFATHSRKPLG